MIINSGYIKRIKQMGSDYIAIHEIHALMYSVVLYALSTHGYYPVVIVQDNTIIDRHGENSKLAKLLVYYMTYALRI